MHRVKWTQTLEAVPIVLTGVGAIKAGETAILSDEQHAHALAIGLIEIEPEGEPKAKKLKGADRDGLGNR